MNKFAIAAFIAATYILSYYGAHGLKCWHCNSEFDPFCKDPFNNKTAQPKDCSLDAELPHLRGIPATMCRKIRMKIYGQWRYKRDCARLGEPGLGGDERYCIFRSGTYNIHMEYCTCNDKPNCNAAPRHSTSSSSDTLLLQLIAGLTAVLVSRQLVK